MNLKHFHIFKHPLDIHSSMAPPPAAIKNGFLYHAEFAKVKSLAESAMALSHLAVKRSVIM